LLHSVEVKGDLIWVMKPYVLGFISFFDTVKTGGKTMRSRIKRLFLSCMVMFLLFTLLTGCAERNDWKKAQQGNSVKAYEDYIKQYPDGKFVEKAKAAVEKMEWEQALATNTPGAFLTFMKKYPKSNYAAQAKAEVDKLIMPMGKDGAYMTLIQGGEFEMGCSDGLANEQPVHKVNLKPFYIDIYEVANAQYQKFVDETNYKRPNHWSDPLMSASSQPVVMVTWYDAIEYCKWAGKRLPTEAEWEKAARGGLIGSIYPWGDKITRADANYYGVDGKDFWERTATVGSTMPNGYGLYEVVGNAEEWCADHYGETYYKESPSENPAGPQSGKYYVVRGGSWGDEYRVQRDFALRIAMRRYADPYEATMYTGFRCVMDVEE